MTYPAPINQFNRLIHVSGNEPTGTYALGSRWNNMHVNPANGRLENYDARNCQAAIGAVAIDAHTGGRITSSPSQVRNAQYDWSGGIGLDDVNTAWARLWPGNQLVLPSSFDWADAIAALKANRFVSIGGDYDQIPYAYQAQKGGTFDHQFGLGGFRASDARVLLYDPLAKRAVWVPQYVIRVAAEKLALVQRGTKSRLFVGLTKPMPPPYLAGVTYRYGGRPTGRGRYLARRDNVPVRSRPETAAPKVAELDHREDFACRQTVGSGAGVWLGTADGTRWVYRQVMWYAGPLTGQEEVR
jgi:hypothetical protein